MTMTPDDPWLANISLPASAVGFDFHMCQCNISLHVRVHGLAVHPAMVQLCNVGTRVKYSGGVGGAGYVPPPWLGEQSLMTLGAPGTAAPGRVAALLLKTKRL